jgi:hypothetical protein
MDETYESSFSSSNADFATAHFCHDVANIVASEIRKQYGKIRKKYNKFGKGRFFITQARLH